jgi:hypothetical protein
MARKMNSKLFKTLGIFVLLPVLISGIAAIIGSGGGGGDGNDSWLFPLWVSTDIAVSDFDGDGRNDVLTLARLSKSMSDHEGHLNIYHQLADGTFWEEDHTLGEYPWQIAAGDLDDDGLPDLLVTDVALNEVWLLGQDSLNNEMFLPPQRVASGLKAYNAAIADFNNDNTSDIALVDNRTGPKRIVMLYQDPSKPGTFLPAEDLGLQGTSDNITTGDLNGDGLADLLVWIYLEPTGYTPNGVLAVSLQQPDGSLGPFTTLAPQTGLNAKNLMIADYNDDGANDLFIFFTPFSEEYHAKFTVILQNPESGTFLTPIDTSLLNIKGIDDAVVADLNEDGKPDYAVVGFFPEGSPSVVYCHLNLFIQSGSGTFDLADVYDIPISASRVASGDIDGDELDDLVVLGSENEVLVLLQSQTKNGTFDSPKPL